MYNSISKAGTGAYASIVAIIMFFAQVYDLPLSESEIYLIINGFVALYGQVMLIYGTFTRNDLEKGLFRR